MGVVKKEEATPPSAGCRAAGLPGFRFHPTDEELVSFYLCRRVLPQRDHTMGALLAFLIPDLDIYKHDPWDLPRLARLGDGSSGCYFFSPRGKKYRNSTKPNRVTLSGFWKATGTDRLVYSGTTSKCIGLKKSLVFYEGRASTGIKSDWTMHEFRLPSHQNCGGNDACWTLCKIFKRKPSNSKDFMEKKHLFAAESSWCSSEANVEPSEGNDTHERWEYSKEDVKSKETTCSPENLNCDSSIASSSVMPTASSYHSQGKETATPGLVGYSESPKGGVSALAQMRAPLTVRVSTSNGWVDDSLSSWFSPTIMKLSGDLCLPGDEDFPYNDEPFQESFALENMWNCSSPQVNPIVPLWDQLAFLQDSTLTLSNCHQE